MIFSLALLFLGGLLLAAFCQVIRLPRIIGMLAAGLILGPYALNLLDPSLLAISADLRKIALIIILIKAGLALNIADLKRIGLPALLMAFLPAAFEIGAFMLIAPRLLPLSLLDAAIMGAVLSAVSPAVVVPRMVALMENKRGTDKSIPQLILAGASLDDVFVIVLFSSFLGMAQGESVSLLTFGEIPVSIVLGIILGIAAGLLLAVLFDQCDRHGKSLSAVIKLLIVLSCAFLLIAAEDALKGHVPLSGLLAVMSMACTLQMRIGKEVTQSLSGNFGKLWTAAEIVLFVLVGAAVDIRYTLEAGAAAVLLIALALVFRSAGVLLCLLKTGLSAKERLFCVIAYLPKATVQAAIGSVPLAMGLPCGNLVLSVAVLGILITAPLGAIGIDLSAPRLLNSEK